MSAKQDGRAMPEIPIEPKAYWTKDVYPVDMVLRADYDQLRAVALEYRRLLEQKAAPAQSRQPYPGEVDAYYAEQHRLSEQKAAPERGGQRSVQTDSQESPAAESVQVAAHKYDRTCPACNADPDDKCAAEDAVWVYKTAEQSMKDQQGISTEQARAGIDNQGNHRAAHPANAEPAAPSDVAGLRAATLAESLLILRARISGHLSPLESMEIKDASAELERLARENARLIRENESFNRGYELVSKDCHNLTEKVIPNIKGAADVEIRRLQQEVVNRNKRALAGDESVAAFNAQYERAESAEAAHETCKKNFAFWNARCEELAAERAIIAEECNRVGKALDKAEAENKELKATVAAETVRADREKERADRQTAVADSNHKSFGVVSRALMAERAKVEKLREQLTSIGVTPCL